MPTYVYQVIKSNGQVGETFEVEQRITERPLDTHPETGEPVRRVPVAPMIGGSAGARSVSLNAKAGPCRPGGCGCHP
ncbi:MAG: zinc ribbon domain-containing protein [Phycisphaerales bacterium]|nr:zinc ribbon domain-containing protein [Phycisphaerales bacterium]